MVRKGHWLIIFDLCSDDPISGEFPIDTCTRAATDSGIGVAAAEKSVRGA